MTRFTKEQVRDELRTIFLFQAAHIEIGAGAAAAETFIGFKPEIGEHGFRRSFLEEDTAKVDLSRFPISEEFELAYDFAFRPSRANFFNDCGNLLNFMKGVPRDAPESFFERVSRHYLTPDGFCQTVAEAAHARWKLEKADKVFTDASTVTFTTRELGLLANMSEGAVRNALADKSENGLRALPGEKPVKVSRDEALRWLAGRRGFLRAPDRPRDDASVRDWLAAVKTIKDLKEFLSVHFSAFDDLDVPQEKVEAWEAGNIPSDLNEIRDFAKAIDVDVPTFVGRVMEAVERRDAAQGGQS
ncbi:protein of unknown function [Methylorubrum extorquens DM4]|uniref:Uncharacterized protein n=1 Tax=Methylorubrum extorquens (strain DSM 6343 / CIP 106787 / DM4) TaxID=661410 RepID=C7C7B5_METED|nr:hypothetical protein [Methylorubrum extorquens]CAX25024.1 protein of unknown function [Methylorubrum extorquens DM4]